MLLEQENDIEFYLHFKIFLPEKFLNGFLYPQTFKIVVFEIDEIDELYRTLGILMCVKSL